MTPEEREIETFRYRGPIVIPLASGRIAVQAPDDKWIVVSHLDELYISAVAYLAWNVLPERQVTRARDMLDELGLKGV